jgi:hypothetical protein
MAVSAIMRTLSGVQRNLCTSGKENLKTVAGRKKSEKTCGCGGP